MRYLLDTNAWIEALNSPAGATSRKLLSTQPSDVALCSIVLGELLVGAYKSTRQGVNLSLIEGIKNQFVCIPFDEAAADAFARIRTFLEKQGTPIGPLDTQIAAIATEHQLILVTNNQSEFSRVPGLILENWI